MTARAAMPTHTCDSVPADLAGMRLDRALTVLWPEHARNRWQTLIADGAVRVNDRTHTSASVKLRGGERIDAAVPPPADPIPAAQHIPLSVLYEDDHLIVVDKPAGLVVHPAPGHPDRTLVNALIAHCGESLQGIGGVQRPGIVHRLDKDTSGVMVVAKTETTHRALVDLFARHDLTRRYTAVVWGVPKESSGQLVLPIGRHPTQRKRMSVRADGRPARTDWALAQELHGVAAVIRCTLHTGRTHQIRVHLSHMGLPLIGDPVYGRKRRTNSPTSGAQKLDLAAFLAIATNFPRQALHADTLGFRHPSTGAYCLFESEFPYDINDLINS